MGTVSQRGLGAQPTPLTSFNEPSPLTNEVSKGLEGQVFCLRLSLLRTQSPLTLSFEALFKKKKKIK